MRKLLSLSVAFILFSSSISWAQAPKIVLFQHFSQASCGPCAAQNPVFDTTVRIPDSNFLHHFIIHTSWPGYDPMYNANTTQSNSMVSYYSVTGVPDIVMDGNVKIGGPTTFTSSDVFTEDAKTSPVKITVKMKDNGKDDSIWVKITTVGKVPPSGNYKLRTAIIERWVHYSKAPGTNGEKDFPDVFRSMIPGTNGQKIKLPAMGNSITYAYDIVKDTTWVPSQLACISYVQNDNTKEILNSSATFDTPNNGLLFPPAHLVQNVTASSTATFNAGIGNYGDSNEVYKVVLISKQPGGWISNFTLAGSTYTDTAIVTIAGDSTKKLVLNVVPGSTPYVGNYTFILYSLTHPNYAPLQLKLNVISGVTDLLVNNSGGLGDGTTKGDASNWMSPYLTGLNATGSKTVAFTDEKVLNQAIIDSALNTIKYVYFNVGWTFPALTDDLAQQLKAFLNNGGNLYMGGQDIAWAAFGSGSQYATDSTKNFLNTYMGVGFVYDGDSTDKTISGVSGEVFDSVTSSKLYNFYGKNSSTGTPYFYPDNLSNYSGNVVFNYNNNSSLIAGVRKNTGFYKSVFFAPGIEMVADTNVAKHIMRITYQWFHGTISDVEYDYLAKHYLKAYPIPSDKISSIILPDNLQGALDVYDLTGKKVCHYNINKNEKTIQLNTASWAPGLYFCQLSNGLSLKIQVAH